MAKRFQNQRKSPAVAFLIIAALFPFGCGQDDSCATLALSITADNVYQLYFNGDLIGSNDRWEEAETYSLTLAAGSNTIAIQASDDSVIAGLLVHADACGDIISSNADWRYQLNPPGNWQSPALDDSAWSFANVEAPYGSGIRCNAYGLCGNNQVQNFPNNSPARWIWSANNPGDHTVWFRYSFSANGGGSHGGNGVREQDEECDGDDFGGDSCSTYGYSSGRLKCSESCLIDTSECTTPSGEVNFNPPFPRIGVLYFYEINLPQEIWKDKESFPILK